MNCHHLKDWVIQDFFVEFSDPDIAKYCRLSVECQCFCPKLVTVFMSAFKSTEQVLAGESDYGNPNQISRIL